MLRTCEQFEWASLFVDTGHSAAKEKENYSWKKNKHRRPRCISVVGIASTLHRTNTENLKQKFPEKELHGHRFHIHVS
jgi:hypothetical protein